VRRLADDPSLCGKVFQPLGILGMAVRVCPMVFAVILDADLPIGANPYRRGGDRL
jgi:hypothetical protein